MFETLGLASGVFFALAWYYMIGIAALAVTFVLCVFNEIPEGSAIFLTGLVFALNFTGIINLGTLEWTEILYFFVIYISIGIVWSLFKYKQKSEEIAKRYKENFPEKNRAYIIGAIKDNICNSEISFWILFFPVSMIKFALDDFVDYLISKLGNIYYYIARAVVNSVFKDAEVQAKKSNKE